MDSECYVNNVYIYGRKVTQFYIDSLLCFKQYIFVLNNQLGGADIEGILIIFIYDINEFCYCSTESTIDHNFECNDLYRF